MGEVYAAENIRTGRRVAVKLLRADTKAKSSAVKRFEQEARAAGTINSDHVTQVFDVCEDEEHGIVIVFELLEGESLIDRLKRAGPVPLDELHPFIEQVWLGLADAHKAGIIHRDLKPSNVFLERRPDGHLRAKILDFGISKVPKEMGGETLTEMGQSLGTFSFMPPEQIGKAKTVDHRADIYACATLIYQALSGQLPYHAKNILVMVDLKTKTDPRPLSEVMGRAVDPRLEGFLSRCLARNPGDRFQTAIDALNAWRELRPASLPPYAGSPSAPPPTPMPPMATPVPPSGPPRSAPPSQQHGAPRSSRYPSTQPMAVPQSSPAPYPQYGQPAADDRLRPRGGTISMDAAAESTGGPTRPMQRVQNVSEPPQLRAVAPTSLPTPSVRQDPRSMAAPPSVGPYQDPRSMHGQYGAPVSSYPPSPPSAYPQGPYNQPGYPPPQNAGSVANAQSVYDEASRGPPSTSQTQPTRVYVPPNVAGQSGLTPSPAAMNHGGPQGSMSPGTSGPGQGMQQQQPSGALRIALWFVAFAIVGFGIVATLHLVGLLGSQPKKDVPSAPIKPAR
jgi:serine/threonine-protein kinase